MYALVRHLRSLIGLDAPPWRKILVERGMDPQVLRRFSGDLRDAYQSCMRVDPLMEFALCAEVQPSMLSSGLVALANRVHTWSPMRADVLSKLVERVARSKQLENDERRALAIEVTNAIVAAIEAEPELAELQDVEKRSRTSGPSRSAEAAELRDARYREVHSELTNLLRQRITFAGLREALEGIAPLPYRS